jgi:CheY-like chemotaxis protein
VRELEALGTEVLVAGVDLGLPQPLLNRLWGAVGHGELPHAYLVDLPAATAAPAPPAVPESGAQAEPAPPPAPMPIPDIPLASNPLIGADDARPRPPQVVLKPIAAKRTVVVVDDDPMMLDVLSRILQRENFELLMARGGPEVIDRLDDYAGDIDLLVTDYAMPDMKGRELADRVRDRFPGVKVLYQTGFSDMLFENRAELEEGAAFLEKPFTARSLREAARLALFGSLNP